MQKNKTCSKCTEEKCISDFPFRKSTNKYLTECKVCANKRKIKWRTENAGMFAKQKKEYYEKNRDKILQKEKIRSSKIRDKLKLYNKSYRDKNKEYLDERKKEYILKNKSAYDIRQRDYRRNRMKVDIEYKILSRLRNRLYYAVKRKFYKKSNKTVSLLGCKLSEFKEYFYGLFTEGMTWKLFLDGEIHIDHKIPCKMFDLSKPEEQQKCFHYTNLQPLWRIENLRKGCSYELKTA